MINSWVLGFPSLLVVTWVEPCTFACDYFLKLVTRIVYSRLKTRWIVQGLSYVAWKLLNSFQRMYCLKASLYLYVCKELMYCNKVWLATRISILKKINLSMELLSPQTKILIINNRHGLICHCMTTDQQFYSWVFPAIPSCHPGHPSLRPLLVVMECSIFVRRLLATSISDVCILLLI